ncbi:phosphatase and actin regulator 2 [Trichonephila clavipes]|nr:phosphatase and actin regulator 2 [Trichonephila clavipes]
MKTSSVNFNSRSPMKTKHRRFAMLRKIFQPWQWKRRKKSDRFEQTSRTLERKISMRSSKEELVKKDVLMPDGTDKNQDSKINVSLLNLPDVEEVPSHDGETVQFSSSLDEKGKKEEVPLRTAYSQVGRLWHPGNPIVSRQRSLRAQAQQIQTKTLRNFWTLEKKQRGEGRRCASRRYRGHIM